MTTTAISRRELLSGAAALGVAAAAGALAAAPAFAYNASGRIVGTCASRHAVISEQLGRFACDAANDVTAVRRAMSTTCCPDCGTRISWHGAAMTVAA